MKRTLCFLLAAFLLTTCKKENDSTQWDINVLSPLFKITLGVSDLIGDSLTQVAPDGSVTLVFDSNIYSTPVDSIFRIEDTLQNALYASPAVYTLTPGFIFYSQPSEIDLDLSNVELSQAIIKSGHAKLIAKNHLHTAVIYTFKIPQATLNGIPFEKVQPLDAAPPGGVTVFSGEFDISGYDIDLTGALGNDYNELTYTVQGQTSPTGITVNIVPGDTIVDVTSGFESMLPLYAKGYLGQGSVSVSESNALGTGRIDAGSILLDSITAILTLKNNIGADAQAILSSMRSVNDHTGTTVNLVAPSLVNRTINMNRATETALPPSPVNATYYSIQLDNTNSNIVSLIENLPDRLEYNLDFNLNPLGNASGHHDFLYTDDLFDANLKVNFPLRFAANQIAFSGTVFMTPVDTTAIENVGDGTFTLIADNGFPFNLSLQLFVIDGSGVTTDSLFIPDTIDPAPLDGNNKAIGKQRTIIHIPLSLSRRHQLLTAPQIGVRARFSTSAYPQLIQIYSDYELDLKLIGDFQYSIR